MSNYGLKVYDSDGNLTLNYTDRITRLRYSTVASADNSGNTTISDIGGRDYLVLSFGLESQGRYYPHIASVAGTTLSWTPRDEGGYYSCDSLILLFYYT